MLIAGGQGTRLQVLTKLAMAKPAVPLAGIVSLIFPQTVQIQDFYCWGVNLVYAS